MGEITMADWREITDEKAKYAAYLCSREWSVKKEAVRERAYGKCERCFINPMDACHHLSYERKYNEKLEDLQANCDACHAFTHSKSDQDPRDSITQISLDHKRGFSAILCPRCEDGYVIPRNVIVSAPAYMRVIVEMMCTCGVDFDLAIQCFGDGTDICASNFRVSGSVVDRTYIFIAADKTK